MNLDFIDRIERGANYTYDIYLRGRPTPLPMSRRYAIELKGRLEELPQR